MKIEKYVVGIISTNIYLVVNEETKETVIVDPGAYPMKVKPHQIAGTEDRGASSDTCPF